MRNKKWVKWAVISVLSAAVVIGVAIAGYALRYRPLSDPFWTGAALDNYRLQYICISTREGRFNPIDLDAVVLHSYACEGRAVDERIKVFPGCQVDEDYLQTCDRPWWDFIERRPAEDLVPGTWLKKS